MSDSVMLQVMQYGKRRIAMFALTILFLVAALLWLLYYIIWGRFYVYTDDAYVNGNIVQLMAQVPGTVIAINTDETQLVKQGQVIIKLDPADMNIALQRADSNLADTVRQVRKAFEDAERAQASVILTNADLMKAQLDVKRRASLVGINAVSREEFQHYQTALKNAKANYDFAVHNLRSAQAIVENAHLYTHPLVERAKANYRTAYLNAQRTTIVAPVTGYVAKRNVQVGQQVMLNTPMLAIIPLKEIWVEANYKESQLKDLRIGQPVSINADAYPDVEYHGTVLGLSAGTGSAFSLLPPQNATGNWIKIVQRLPVRVRLREDEIIQHPLQLGLSMHVTVDVHHTDGHMLAQTAESTPVYSTDVYTKQLADADNKIAAILGENAPDMFMPRVLNDG